MSYDETVIAQVDAPEIENNNPIEDLLAAIEAGEYNDAEHAFNDIIGDRLQDTLDQAKIQIADRVFNAQQDVDVESEEEDIIDEEDLDLDLDLDDDEDS